MDYVTQSPVFRPTSKPDDVRPALGLEGLAAAALRSARPIVALGGDGLMLRPLHKLMKTGKPIYGMHRGTVGFLMNKVKSSRTIAERVARAKPVAVAPLPAG